MPGQQVSPLSLNYAAYEAEVFRAGFLSVDRGQTEAALSLGLIVATEFLPHRLAQAIPAHDPSVRQRLYLHAQRLCYRECHCWYRDSPLCLSTMGTAMAATPSHISDCYRSLSRAEPTHLIFCAMV